MIYSIPGHPAHWTVVLRVPVTRPLTVVPGVCVPLREPAINATKVRVPKVYLKLKGFNNKYCGWLFHTGMV